MAGDPSKDDWVRTYNTQQKAAEEMEKIKVVRKKEAQKTMRKHLDEQMKVHERRISKTKEVRSLEGEKERLEYEQWVAEERKAYDQRKSKVLEQKAARDVQIDSRKARREAEKMQQERDEAEETMMIKAEIQRAKEEAIAKKLAEKERLRQVFEEVKGQQQLKEIEKQKIAQEDVKAAEEYKKMVDAAEEARSSYFVRKVSDNESMAKALDDIFGARERERLAKEKATLERIVREEEQRLKDLDERKKNNRRLANQERLLTLQAQMQEKQARIEREKAEERAAAMQALAMSEKASRQHEAKLAEKQRKLMEYKRSLEIQIHEREGKDSFPMSEAERKMNKDMVAIARGEKPLDKKALTRFNTPI